MKKLAVICVIAVIVYFGLLTYFAAHETMLRELFAGVAGFAVLILMLISFVLGVVTYHRNKFLAFIPFLICLFGLPTGFVGAIAWGESIKASNFQKSLPRFTKVVRLIENGQIKPDARGEIQLLASYSDLAYSTLTWTNQGERTIEFLTDGAFPVWHAGYIYTSSGVTNELMKGRNCIERVNTNWFYVSD